MILVAHAPKPPIDGYPIGRISMAFFGFFDVTLVAIVTAGLGSNKTKLVVLAIYIPYFISVVFGYV